MHNSEELFGLWSFNQNNSMYKKFIYGNLFLPYICTCIQTWTSNFFVYFIVLTPKNIVNTSTKKIQTIGFSKPMIEHEYFKPLLQFFILWNVSPRNIGTIQQNVRLLNMSTTKF